jgi:hypothetical protein
MAEATLDQALELPADPTPPDKMMSLEHVAAYEKDLGTWEKEVQALIKTEMDRVRSRRSLLQYRRKHWPGW